MTDFAQVTQEYRDELKALKAAYQAKAQQSFTDGTRHLFEQYPELDSFEWHQYTGYFCDGDPCYFNVYHDPDSLNLVINGELWSGYDGEMSYYDTFEYEKPSYTRKIKEGMERPYQMFNDVNAFLEAFDDDVYLEMFGDHMRVKVTKEGAISYGEYDHD